MLEGMRMVDIQPHANLKVLLTMGHGTVGGFLWRSGFNDPCCCELNELIWGASGLGPRFRALG